MVKRTHERGIKVFGATLLPFGGSNSFSEPGEQMRQAVNHWIRTTGVFDGIIDFDKAVRNPADPSVLSFALDSGDHLHPNDAGYKTMKAA